MNKKGSFMIASEMVVWLVRIFILIAVLIVVILIVTAGTHKVGDINNVKLDSLIINLFYSDKCLVNDPGIVEIEKISLAEKCFFNENIAFKLTIKRLDDNIEYVKINNPDLFEAGSELCVVPGKYVCKSEIDYILINENGKLSKALFQLDAVFEE